MAFAHPSWRLTQGQTYDIAFTVDQMSPLRARAVAVGPNLVEVWPTARSCSSAFGKVISCASLRLDRCLRSI
jgi:hypothetical protein